MFPPYVLCFEMLSLILGRAKVKPAD